MNPQGVQVDPKLLTTAMLVFALFTSLAIGATIISRYRKSVTEVDDRPEDVLESLQTAYDEGELDEAEFHKVRKLLTEQLETKQEFPKKLSGK